MAWLPRDSDGAAGMGMSELSFFPPTSAIVSIRVNRALSGDRDEPAPAGWARPVLFKATRIQGDSDSRHAIPARHPWRRPEPPVDGGLT